MSLEHSRGGESASPPPPATLQPVRRVRNTSVEGLLRGLAVREGDPDFRAVLEVLGVPGPALPQHVPVERFGALLEHLARRHFPGTPRDEALRQVGARLFHGYRGTVLGHVMLAALNMMGPDRVVRSAPHWVGRNVDFGERSAVPLGPHHWRVTFRGVPLPGDYYCGLLAEGLRVAGAAAPAVTFRQTGAEDMEFEARW